MQLLLANPRLFGHRFIVSKCPSLAEYSPAPWAPGPCSQTVYASMVRTEEFQYKREMLKMQDGVRVALDWCPFEDDLPLDTPVILCLHGIGAYKWRPLDAPIDAFFPVCLLIAFLFWLRCFICSVSLFSAILNHRMQQ